MNSVHLLRILMYNLSFIISDTFLIYASTIDQPKNPSIGYRIAFFLSLNQAEKTRSIEEMLESDLENGGLPVPKHRRRTKSFRVSALKWYMPTLSCFHGWVVPTYMASIFGLNFKING